MPSSQISPPTGACFTASISELSGQQQHIDAIAVYLVYTLQLSNEFDRIELDLICFMRSNVLTSDFSSNLNLLSLEQTVIRPTYNDDGFNLIFAVIGPAANQLKLEFVLL